MLLGNLVAALRIHKFQFGCVEPTNEQVKCFRNIFGLIDLSFDTFFESTDFKGFREVLGFLTEQFFVDDVFLPLGANVDSDDLSCDVSERLEVQERELT